MRINSLMFAAMILLASPIAQAATYTYTGNPTFGTASYVTATVELNCAGPCAAGDYLYASGMSEYSLSVYSSTNELLLSLSSQTPDVVTDPFVNYLTLGASGNVTSWFLFLDGNGTLTPRIYSMGHDLGPPSTCMCGTQDFGYTHPTDTTFVNLVDTPGNWQVAAVPEPSTWVMLILGFAGVGFKFYTRKHNPALARA